mgnify:CR=1 FL=1
MEIKSTNLLLKTKKEFEIIDLTKKIISLIKKSKIGEGFVNIFSKHTTLAIKINENEPLLIEDMNSFMNKIVDKKEDYRHDIISLRKDCPKDEPKNAGGHHRTLILETNQTIPISKNKLQLGRYQKIMAIETSGPRERQILIQIIGI